MCDSRRCDTDIKNCWSIFRIVLSSKVKLNRIVTLLDKVLQSQGGGLSTLLPVYTFIISELKPVLSFDNDVIGVLAFT